MHIAFRRGRNDTLDAHVSLVSLMHFTSFTICSERVTVCRCLMPDLEKHLMHFRHSQIGPGSHSVNRLHA